MVFINFKMVFQKRVQWYNSVFIFYIDQISSFYHFFDHNCTGQTRVTQSQYKLQSKQNYFAAAHFSSRSKSERSQN
jgi:hypothetical protein